MLDYGGDWLMPRIKVLAKIWPQHVDGSRYERRAGDIVDASDADAARLIKTGAAEPTKRKVTVANQKDTSEDTAPKTTEAVAEKQVEEELPPQTETYQDTFTLLPADEIEMAMPAQSATTELWQEYAIAAGMPADVAREKKRDELRQLFA